MSETTLGKTIALRRKSKGWTQFELAEQLKVSDKAVSKWERDAACPDIASFTKLAQVLDVSSDELLALVPIQEIRSRGTKTHPTWKIVKLALVGVGLAMGVAVAVLSVLGVSDANTSVAMLGLGMACFGVYLLDGADDNHSF